MIRIRQIKINVGDEQKNTLEEKVCKLLKINKSDLKNIIIHKRSIDARKKPIIFYVYEVDIEVINEDKILKNVRNENVLKTPDESFIFEITGTKLMEKRPVIIGSGPAGLFCAYILAEHGYNPIIIEQGQMVEKRVLEIQKFWDTGVLNEKSNVQFGEGGAGTFSDGKLNTLIKDSEHIHRRVFEIFVECGAPEEIMYVNKPHIGTDILRNVIKNMRNKIISMGGEFRFETELTNIYTKNNQITKIELNYSELLEVENIVLAIGHSARKTFVMLEKLGLEMESKPFAVGLRVQHLQKTINESQYGSFSDKLPAAEYKLTYTTKNNRGVYSFCICPGGYVVNASSEIGKLAINGMSNHKRDSSNANSAIVVTINSNDFGKNPLDSMYYQQELEKRFFDLKNGKIPLQKLGDFINNKESKSIGDIKPEIKGKYELTNIRKILPNYISESIIEAMPEFGKKIKGFDNKDVLLAGIESRTSSPIRIKRDENFESNIKGIFLCGEGPGYAGGITTSAIDGVKLAKKLASIYKPN